jgi:hypothetical protein
MIFFEKSVVIQAANLYSKNLIKMQQGTKRNLYEKYNTKEGKCTLKWLESKYKEYNMKKLEEDFQRIQDIISLGIPQNTRV